MFKSHHRSPNSAKHLARIMFCVFLLTFICARAAVFLIMARKIPDLFLYVGDTHVHHLNYGIFLLSIVGCYMLLTGPAGRALEVCAVMYAFGLALTFDEFGMWLHLGGTYWQRASFDAVTVVAALLGFISVAPDFRRMRLRHWFWFAVSSLMAGGFFILLANSFNYAERVWIPKWEQIEAAGPK